MTVINHRVVHGALLMDFDFPYENGTWENFVLYARSDDCDSTRFGGDSRKI